MKRLLSFALICAFGLSFITGISFAADIPFKDVPKNAWYYEDVCTAYSNNLINGKKADTFAPNDKITYAEVLKLAACMNQLYIDGAVTLKNGNPWYQSYVDYCLTQKIILPVSTYDYIATATREEFLKIFANALPKEAFAAINEVPENSIPDYNSASMYANDIYMLYRAGILAGVNEKHELNPKASITRAEVATILTRMMYSDKRAKFSMGDAAPEIELAPEELEKPKITEESISKSEIEPEVVPEEKPNEPEDTADNYEPFEVVVQPVNIAGANEGDVLQYTVKASGGKTPYTYSWGVRGRYNEVTSLKETDYTKGVNTNTLSIKFDVNTPITNSFRCEITDALGQKVKSNYVKLPELLFLFRPESISKNGDELQVIGTVEKGSVKVGDPLAVYYAPEKFFGSGNVTKLEMFEKSLDEIDAGDRAKIYIGGFVENIPLEFVTDAYSEEIIDHIWQDSGFAVKIPLRAETTSDTCAVNLGTIARFEVVAAGGKKPYTYQWQSRQSKGMADSEYKDLSMFYGGAEGYDTNVLTLEVYELALLTDMKYRCIVTDADGNQAITEPAGFSALSKPYFTYSKTDYYANYGDEVALTFDLRTPSNTEVEYQWQILADNYKDFVDIVPADTWAKGATTDTLTIEVDKAQFEGHAKYQCIITTSRGEKLTYGSFEILPRNVFITKQPENVSANAGDTVRFSVVAEGSVQPFTYEWQMKNKSMAGYGAIPKDAEWAKGQKTSELSSVVFPADFEDEVQYRCKITDADGVTRYSNPVTVTEKQEKPSGMIVIMD